jgi:hypothetical protein
LKFISQLFELLQANRAAYVEDVLALGMNGQLPLNGIEKGSIFVAVCTHADVFANQFGVDFRYRPLGPGSSTKSFAGVA